MLRVLWQASYWIHAKSSSAGYHAWMYHCISALSRTSRVRLLVFLLVIVHSGPLSTSLPRHSSNLSRKLLSRSQNDEDITPQLTARDSALIAPASISAAVSAAVLCID